MTTVTRLSFASGDREALEALVADLKRLVERKGAECKGPHSEPPEQHVVPLYRRLQPGDRFSPWKYTAYSRWLEIHGNDETARQVAHADFPEHVHVEIEVDRKQPLGRREK